MTKICYHGNEGHCGECRHDATETTITMGVLTVLIVSCLVAIAVGMFHCLFGG